MLLFVFVAVFASTSCASGEEDVPRLADRAVAVRVITPEVRDLRRTLPYVGTVRFERTVRVSSQIPGVLDEQVVDEGASVAGGDRLGRILAPELASRVAQVEAELRRARAERDFVCDTLQTDERLAKSGAIEPIRVETTRKNCASASEAVRAAEARRVEVRTARGRTVEQAPDDGQVLRWLVEPGEYVGPGKPLLLFGTGPKLATVNVAEPDLQRGMEVGMAVVLRAQDDEATARVSHVAPTRMGPARSTRVEIVLPEGFASLPDGASVDVDFIVGSAENAVVIPEAALVENDEGSSVFVADETVARRVEVSTGLRADGLVAVAGLPGDARVITTQVRSLNEGARLYIVEATQ